MTFFIKHMHSSAVLLANPNQPGLANLLNQANFNAPLPIQAGNIANNLQVGPYLGGIVNNPNQVQVPRELPLISENLVEYKENLPWLVDDEGKILNYNQSINLFKGIHLISKYLTKKYGEDLDRILSTSKLSEYLKPFIEENKEITIIELYNHVVTTYKNNKDLLISEIGKEDFITINEENPKGVEDKFLGDFGEITFNQAVTSLKQLNWEFIINSTQITINTLPVLTNFVGFGFIMKSYMKHVYHRPYSIYDVTIAQKLKIDKLRNKELLLFSIIGVPALLYILKNTALQYKNTKSINVSISALPTGTGTESIISAELQNSNNNNLINKSNPLFMLLAILKNKIPSLPGWLKFLFSYSIIVLFILRLLGFNNYLEFFLNNYYIKLYMCVTIILVILFLILELIILHFMLKKSIKISKVLPKFIIEWLQYIEDSSNDPESFKLLKNTNLRLVYISIFIFILVIIVL